MIYTVTLNPSIDFIVKVDELQLGTLNYMQEAFKFPGGKGINVSRILQRLGEKSTTLGFLGGFSGAFIQQALRDEGLSQEFTTIKADTRINIKLKAAVETEINETGPQLSQNEIDAFKQTLSHVTSDDTVILSGSLPPSLPQNFYSDLIAIIKEKEAQFVIDTTGESLLKALPDKPLLVKPNQDELAELFQTTFHSVADIIPYGRKLLDKGAQHALVSMGSQGALLFSGKDVYQAQVPKGLLKNSVGAGDSMVAGFVSQLVCPNSTIETAFTYGVAAGSATAFSDDLATKAMILALIPQVTLTKIS